MLTAHRTVVRLALSNELQRSQLDDELHAVIGSAIALLANVDATDAQIERELSAALSALERHRLNHPTARPDTARLGSLLAALVEGLSGSRLLVEIGMRVGEDIEEHSLVAVAHLFAEYVDAGEPIIAVELLADTLASVSVFLPGHVAVVRELSALLGGDESMGDVLDAYESEFPKQDEPDR